MKKLHASSAADLLATIPHNLGFKPTDSLVMVTVNGLGIAGATLRVDLGSLSAPGAVDHYVGLLRKDPTAERAIIVIYDDTPNPLQWKDLYLQLTDALEEAQLRLADGWLVADTHFYSLSCEDPDCCPPLPVQAIEDSALNAEMIFAGSSPADRAGIHVPAAPTGEALKRVSTLIQEVHLPALNGNPEDFAQRAMAEASVEWWCALGSDPVEEVAVQLIAHLGRKPVRDRLMADSIGAPTDSAGYRAALTGRSKTVRWEETIQYQRLVLSLLAHAPSGQPRADLLAFAAFIEWHKGRTSNAVDLLEQAQDTDPGHRLSRLLTSLLATGIVPDVCQRSETAYHEATADV